MTTGEQLKQQGAAETMAADYAIGRDVGPHLRKIITELAAALPEFTADDVWTHLYESTDPASVHALDQIKHRHNLLPAHFNAAARAGEITHTGRYMKAQRRLRRAGVIGVWTRGDAA